MHMGILKHLQEDKWHCKEKMNMSCIHYKDKFPNNAHIANIVGKLIKQR
jgi:hypothetical protein